MTLDEFIEYFRYSTAVGFTFSESQQIANYLEISKGVIEQRHFRKPTASEMKNLSNAIEVNKRMWDEYSKSINEAEIEKLKCELDRLLRNQDTIKFDGDIVNNGYPKEKQQCVLTESEE